MNKTMKVLRIVSIVILSVAILVAIAGAVLMFTDVYLDVYPSPKSGALPTVGTVFAIASLVLFCVTKKSSKGVVCALITTVIAQATLYLSVLLLDYGHSENAWLGYRLCLGSAGAVSLVFIFSIIILITNYLKAPMPGSGEFQFAGGKHKALRIITIIVFIIATAFAIVGALIMFGDTTFIGERIVHRTTGIMPACGMALLVFAMISLILAKKNPKWTIGTWVATIVAQTLLSVSFLFIHGIEAMIGYWLCVGASSVASIGFILALVYGILSLRNGSTPAAVAASGPIKDDYKTSFSQAAALLKEAKDLLDSGIYTEEEFKMQKEMVFKQYGLFAQGKGTENENPDTPENK